MVCIKQAGVDKMFMTIVCAWVVIQMKMSSVVAAVLLGWVAALDGLTWWTFLDIFSTRKRRKKR